MSEHIVAPFTPEQVAALNEYQRAGWFHPFTCGRCRDKLGLYDQSTQGYVPNDRKLLATESGWVCPTCDYTQNWAHAEMAEPLPPAPFSVSTPTPENHK